jgi:hypothetical protein
MLSRRWPLFGFFWLYQKSKEVLRSKAGLVATPHALKHALIKECARKNNLRVFVETGTCFGDTLWATRNVFRELFSIELDPRLYEGAHKRFKKYNHVHLFFGNSAEVLPRLLGSIYEPCLFWLDAHYSGQGTAKGDKETPIYEEIDIITRCLKVNCVILIDDARDFKGQNGYPTLEKLKQFVLSRYPTYTFEVKDDIIRIYEDK